MAFQPCPSIAHITNEGRLDNQLTVLDLAFFASGAITPVSLAALVSGVANWFATQLAPLVSEQWTATRTVGTDLTTATGPRIEQSVVAVGGVSGESAPNNVAACVSFRTEQRGRSARGRNFVMGVPNSLVTLNTLDSGFISDLISAYLSLVGPGGLVAGWQWVVLSRQTGGVLRANGIGIPITDVTMVGNSVRSMRSREIGHGA